MHKQLKHQLQKYLGVIDSLPEEWKSFLDEVDMIYHQMDAERQNQKIQSNALLDAIQSISMGETDVEVFVPEDDNPLAELSVGLKKLITELNNTISEQEIARESLESALAQTEGLFAGSNRVSRARDLEELLISLVQSTSLQYLDRANIMLFDNPIPFNQRPNELTVHAVWEKHGDDPVDPVGTRYDFDNYPISYLINPNEPLVIKDLTTDQRLDKQVKEHFTEQQGFRGIVTWPLTVPERWIGVVTTQSRAAVKLNDKEMRQIATLIDQAAIVIQGIQLNEQLQEALAEAEATQQFYIRSQWQDFLEKRDPLHGRFTYEKSKTKLTPEGISTDRGVVDPQTFSEEDDAFLTIPLVIRGQPIGVVGIETPEGIDRFPEEQQSLAEDVSQQLALALENVRLIEESQRTAAREQLTSKVGARVRETLDIESILKTASSEIRQALNLPEVIIRLGPGNISPDRQKDNQIQDTQMISQEENA
jgi:GAF domain-containing protein